MKSTILHLVVLQQKDFSNLTVTLHPISKRAQGQCTLAPRVQKLAELVEKQGKALEEQQSSISPPDQTITQLRNSQYRIAVAERSGTRDTILSYTKAPSLPYFTSEKESCTSTRVKSFIYNLKKAGTFSNLPEARTMALAECHLTDVATS